MYVLPKDGPFGANHMKILHVLVIKNS